MIRDTYQESGILAKVSIREDQQELGAIGSLIRRLQ